VKKFCNTHGEDPLVVVVRPSDGVLGQRIRIRWGGGDVRRQMTEAREFYRQLPSGVIVLDSSGPKEEMFCGLLALLSKDLTLAEGYDVIVSYGGPQAGIAEDIRTVLKVADIRAFVASADPLPSLDPTAQQNIDRVFRLADVIVVVWSEDYPRREFASYEWTNWVSPTWKQNESNLVFVTIGDAALPPEARTAHHIRWEGTGTEVLNCVKQRLEKINRSSEECEVSQRRL
jgi:hypothetical protein